MNQFKILKSLLPEDGRKFPIGEGICAIRGKTLAKTKQWWKAILLIKTTFGDYERYQLRLYGWQKNKEGVYKVRQKFNVSISPYISDIISILQIFVQESGEEQVLEKIYEKLIERVNELERTKIRLERQKGRIPELKRKIKEFKKLLNDPKINETKIHKFLKENTWMFGTNYTRMFKSEKWITIRSKYDFLLKRFDGYFDILELKSPKAELFVKTRGKKRALSKELKNAISQAMIYLAEARIHYLSIEKETGLDVYFPEGIIVIGRRKEEDKELLRIHNEFLHNIEIWTYDDLLDTAKKTIEIYESYK